MSSSVMFFGISEEKNKFLLREKLINFVKTNYDTSLYESEGQENELIIHTNDDVIVDGENYEIGWACYVNFEERADENFLFNFPGFSTKKISTKSGLSLTINFLYEFSVFHSNLGILKFGLDMMKKMLDISGGYLGLFEIEKNILEKYKDEIELAIDDQGEWHYMELYLLNSQVLDKIYSSESELTIFLKNQQGIIGL